MQPYRGLGLHSYRMITQGGVTGLLQITCFIKAAKVAIRLLICN